MPDDQIFRRPEDDSLRDRVEEAEQVPRPDTTEAADIPAADHAVEEPADEEQTTVAADAGDIDDAARADQTTDGPVEATLGSGEADQPTAVRPAVTQDVGDQGPMVDRESGPDHAGPEDGTDVIGAAGAETDLGTTAAEVPPPILPVPPEFRQSARPGADDPPTEEPPTGDHRGEGPVDAGHADAEAEDEADVGQEVAGHEVVEQASHPAPESRSTQRSTDPGAVSPAGQEDRTDVPAPVVAGPMPADTSSPAPDSPDSMDGPTSAGAGAPASQADEPAGVDEPVGVDDEAPKGRTFREWLRPDLSQTVIAILLAAFSFAVVTQIRTRDQVDSYSMLRQSDLVAMLDGLDQESERLESELDSLRQAQAELESGQDSEELARAQAEERLTSLGILAGTLPAQGPGITLTISDPQRNVKPGMILDAVEEMRDAGAEAIQVNGTIRVVANSWVASGASGIIIDGQAVSTPITIDVIGDPHSLEEAARFRGGLVSQITDSRVGGQVSIVRSDNLEISALHRQQAPRYASPDESAAGEGDTATD